MKKYRLALLLSLVFVSAVAFAPFALADPPGKTIVEVAREINADTGEFSTLLAAISAADPAVLNTLSGDGQFTVFAPTDAAFRVIGMAKDNVGTAFRQDVLTSILRQSLQNSCCSLRTHSHIASGEGRFLVPKCRRSQRQPGARNQHNPHRHRSLPWNYSCNR